VEGVKSQLDNFIDFTSLKMTKHLWNWITSNQKKILERCRNFI